MDSSIADNISTLLGHTPYLDTNIYIYAFEGFAQARAQMLPLLDFLGNDRVDVVASELVLAELLSKPMALDDQALIDAYLDFFDDPDGPKLVQIERSVLMLAAELRADEGLMLADAVHLATALDQGCTSFLTADTGFHGIEDIDVVYLSQLTTD